MPSLGGTQGRPNANLEARSGGVEVGQVRQVVIAQLLEDHLVVFAHLLRHKMKRKRFRLSASQTNRTNTQNEHTEW